METRAESGVCGRGEKIMEQKTVKCCWCDGDFYANETRESRFLGGLVCGDCDADNRRPSLGEVEQNKRERARSTAWNQGRGWVC